MSTAHILSGHIFQACAAILKSTNLHLQYSISSLVIDARTSMGGSSLACAVSRYCLGGLFPRLLRISAPRIEFGHDDFRAL